MLNKILSLLVILGLIATTNFSVLAQSSEVKNSQQSSASLKKEISLIKFGINPAERANQLLDRDYFFKVKADDLSSKKMQDADNAQQKRKSEGIGTTTAIVIGAALAAAIIIVLAARGNRNDNNSPCRLSGVTTPCPPGCVCIQ
ncbi:hypothetical protein BH24ACI2_BH24ACI2_09940 [soil metagenome]|jgi:F0F1-type ATP synthase assembly protein I